ncbi:Acyl-CoA N-acyltransferase [Artemisia annua]|uniref:Acyl-CoA N-acyltransferase n=1 Tax=Artemisia annua TaxID=35608 RepID=A0A2U1KPN9_ARTAN|nr:Acyl-CoA N-acyltransferase [Artemisia annua]
MKLRTRTVKRKTTNPKMELKIRPKRNARAPKMPGFLVEPVFKRTRCPVLRQNAENNVATETSPAGALVSEMMSCSLCEENFHRSCVKKVKALNINTSSLYFCGTIWREIHTKLNESFGKKMQLQDGFSFSLLKSYDLRKRLNKIDPIKAECKPKLAKAFDILNQCFRPSVDAINNTNIIQHLMYNRGSHLRRLNYSGFFMAILEKDDEVISTATIRIHGNKLAEMSFVVTREKYWGKGMCRRLLNSIENVLGSFGVEELVLPSTSTEETLQIWTKLGFKPLKESTKQTMKSMNIAVFAGTTILQKRIPKNKNQKLRQISQYVSVDLISKSIKLYQLI